MPRVLRARDGWGSCGVILEKVSELARHPEFVVVAGLSGAGRSTVGNTLEDLGWYVIDNLPPSLIAGVVELAAAPGSQIERLALVAGRTSTTRT